MPSKKFNIFVHTVFAIMMVVVIFPLFALVMVSLSNSQDILDYGYKAFPLRFDSSAYQLIFSYSDSLMQAMLISILSSVVAPALGVVVMSLGAYGISAREFAYKKTANGIMIFTMLFNAGLVPTYIVYTQWYDLGDSIWIYLLPAVSVWNIIVFRTFFLGIPSAIIESAKIDGASELYIFTKIMLPMSKPALSSVFFLQFLYTWNDYTKPLYYITNKELYNVQYYMQNILREAKYLNQLYKDNPLFSADTLPAETLPFAITVISLIPIVLVFPYMQKFFSKGIAVGSVKG